MQKHNKSRQQGRFAPGPLYSGPCMKRYEAPILRAFLTVIFVVLSGCTSEYEQGNLIVYPSGDRSFNYEVVLPESDGKKPLVVFSHGSGGDYHSYDWVFEALVKNGYVVAAFNHPFDNAMNNTDKGVLRVWDRPQDVSLLVDALLADQRWSAHIDPNRISVVGHSSGGYTALSLGGALFKPDLMIEYCSGNTRGPDCDLANNDVSIDYSTASLSYKDDRVKSVVAMAPALGPGVEQRSLEAVNIPVLILATEDDELLKLEKHAKYYAKHLPNAELRLLVGGGHFIYMECNFITHIANLFIDNMDICGGQFDVNRNSVRQEAASLMVDFLNASAAPNPHNKYGLAGTALRPPQP